MIDKYNYFLHLAKNLNVTKASKDLFVSQQNLSSYLKKLEEYYGVMLFNRKPSLSLTEAGEAVFDAYNKIDFIQNELEKKLESIRTTETGKISIGIHSSRSTILLPDIIADFIKKFPAVSFDINDGVVTNFEKSLINGTLDYYIGTKPENSIDIEAIPLIPETIYLIASDRLLEEYFPDQYPDCKKQFEEGVNLSDFTHVPFLYHSALSRVIAVIDEYLNASGIQLNKVFSTNNGDLRIALSGKGVGASFTTQLCFDSVHKFNRMNPGADLNVYPINGISCISNSFISFRKDSYQPRYMKCFLDLVIKRFESTGQISS